MPAVTALSSSYPAASVDGRAEIAARTRAAILDAVASHLAARDITVMARDWHADTGILDLAASSGAVVCGPAGTRKPLIREARARRIRELAGAWIQASDLTYDRIRIDYAAVTRAPQAPGGYLVAVTEDAA